MAISQDTRLLNIKTPLGKDFLLLEKIRVEEGISKLFSIDVDLLHEEEADGYEATIAKIGSLLGKNVTISIEQKDKTARKFSGIINAFSQGTRGRADKVEDSEANDEDSKHINDLRFTSYKATVVPRLWLLTLKHQSRIFQHLNVPDILQKVLKESKIEFSWQVTGDYKPRNYCVQYNETDFDFISRLMEEEGIFYFFEHSGDKHTMIVSDSPQSHVDCPGKNIIPFSLKEEDEGFTASIHSWNVRYKLMSGKISLRDHHFQLTTNKLEGQEPTRFTDGDNQALEVYKYPAGYARKYDDVDSGGGDRADTTNISGEKEKTPKASMQGFDVEFRKNFGEGNCSSLTAGYRFKMKNHPNAEYNKPLYIITSIIHEAEQSSTYASGYEVKKPYHNEFTCLIQGDGAPPFRPLRQTAKPVVRGSQTAMVVGPAGEEIFTDKYGRVKVQFHWDREGKNNADSSCWIRVGTLWAGKQWGVIHIPRIGQEVIVDFIEGDPDQPIIVGSVYNPDTMPPYKLPDNKTQSGVQSRSSKGGSPANFNEFRFEDKKGSEEVYLHAEKDWTIMVEHDKNQIVGHDETHLVKHDRTKTINHDETTFVHHDRTETVDNNETITIGVNRTETVGSNETITIGGNRTETVGGNEILTIAGNQTDDIVGNRTSSISGNEKNSVTATKSVNVGTDYTLSATTSITESSKDIKITAGKTLTLAGPGGSIVIDAKGVTIFGVLVKIN